MIDKSKIRSKKDKLQFLEDAIVMESKDQDFLEFTADELHAYCTGAADLELRMTIDAARQIDSQVDDEIRVLEGELDLIAAPIIPAKTETRIWQFLTLGLGAAACGLGAVLFFNTQNAPQKLSVLNGGLTTIYRVGGKTFAQSELSQAAVNAITSRTIPAGDAWKKVAPIGGARPAGDEFSISTPVNTTLPGNLFSLAFSSPSDISDLKLIIDGPVTRSIELKRNRYREALEPGLYKIRVQGVASNGQLITTRFTIRIMTDVERAAYETDIAKATNPIDQLLVYAKYGIRDEFDRLKTTLGDTAPSVSSSIPNMNL